jgi:hypothetical protein
MASISQPEAPVSYARGQRFGIEYLWKTLWKPGSPYLM